MKYLKLFEDNKNELIKLIPELEEASLELKDHDYEINIELCNKRLIDFPDNETRIPADYISDYMLDDLTNIISFTINRYEEKFYINDFIIDNLLFIESYAKDVLKLKVNFYDYYEDNYDHYCKNIKDLIKNSKVNWIQIGFIKA
jgi:hypothetical protein